MMDLGFLILVVVYVFFVNDVIVCLNIYEFKFLVRK